MNLIEILNKRFEFEEITKGYNAEHGSDIDSIEWFIENGHRSNSLRNGFDDALKIAKEIKEFSNECTKTIGAGEQIRSF
tara:strand:+ start:590 stop:826 length:237 start_codon:yes stop_codon:yes gene_type:complete